MRSSSHLTRRRVVVHGQVQGVFFRASTREQASTRRVAGWVRNLRDGTVEAEIEGTDEAVAGLIDWMRRGGPAGAIVGRVDVDSIPPVGDDSFEVR